MATHILQPQPEQNCSNLYFANLAVLLCQRPHLPNLPTPGVYHNITTLGNGNSQLRNLIFQQHQILQSLICLFCKSGMNIIGQTG
ncbi:MAG: hypothetical protein VKL59_03910 [Nostocaceae cyanobacterium]|nr:hypothetical protein [Nostocaceae cyanobacterium]